jgi:SOS-response transcriptional repressor LexA
MNHEMEMRFTEKQGQYLAFIYNYSKIHGRAPAEADLERHFKTTPPTIHQMILKLEEKGLISRVPGQPRSIRLLIQPEELPILWRGKQRAQQVTPADGLQPPLTSDRSLPIVTLTD